MTEQYRLFVPFRPQAQARPRFNRRSGHAYQPEPEFKSYVVAEAYKNRPPRPLDGALEIRLAYCYKRPACRKYEIYKTTKPDLDNLDKPVFDALKRAQWLKDDCCIVKASNVKIWADFDGLEIRVQRLNNVRAFGA